MKTQPWVPLVWITAALALGLPGNVTGGEAARPFQGLCYGPFRQGQAPGGTYPSEAEIREDIDTMESLATVIRTYGNESILYRIPEFCNDAGLDCIPGAWIGGNAAADWQQVSNLVTIADEEYPTTRMLIVGSETLQFNRTPKTNLINYILYVQTNTTHDVGTAEIWNIWTNPAHSDLVAAVDFIGMHCHPYWDGVAASNAAAHVANCYALVTNLYPGKPVIVAETGFPSAGDPRGNAIPSSANQEHFLTTFDGLARSNGMDYLLFEAFDEPWKSGESGGVGTNWGIMDASREPKASLEHILTGHTRILDFDATSIVVRTYSDDDYAVRESTNLIGAGWEPLTNFVGQSGTNRTHVTIPESTDAVRFVKALLLL